MARNYGVEKKSNKDMKVVNETSEAKKGMSKSEMDAMVKRMMGQAPPMGKKIPMSPLTPGKGKGYG